MPLENTSRSPRRANWRGRKPSSAKMEARMGKPLKAVFAARTRIAAVKPWTGEEPDRVGAEHGAGDLGDHGPLVRSRPARRSAAIGSCATCTFAIRASAVIPTNITMVSPPMIARVAPRCGSWARLKLGTPLLTASTPVRAVHPDANARSSSATSSSPDDRALRRERR